MNINWKNMITSLSMGIILAFLFLLLFGFSVIDEFCDEEKYQITESPNSSTEQAGKGLCLISSVLIYGGSFAIILLSTLCFYFILGFLQKRKTSKKVE